MKTHLTEKSKTSKKLLGFAWGLEIAFVTLGLLSATSITLAAVLNENEEFNLGLIGLLIAMPGFLVWYAIAFAELIKIPLVQGILYAKNLVVKGGALIFLGFICFLTFDNMKNGLISSMDLRHEKMNNHFIELSSYNDQITILSNKITYLSDNNEKDITQKSYKSIEPQVIAIDHQINTLKGQIADLRKSTDTFEIAEMKRQINYLVSENAKYRALITETNSSYDEKLANNKNNELIELKNTVFGKQKIKERYQSQRAGLISERDEIIADYKKSLKTNEIQISRLNDKVGNLSILSTNTQEIIDSYNQEIISLTSQKSKIYTKINQDISKNITQSKNAEIEVNNLVDEKIQLEKEKSVIVTALNKTGDDLVLVFAKWLQNRNAKKVENLSKAEHIADLDPSFIEEAKFIVNASLSIVVAIAGPILALIAVNNQIEDQRRPKRNKFTYSLRRLFVDLRRKLRKPKIITEVVEQEVEKIVEVTKEVPVEKVVKEVIEVIKPVEITRYVGIPVPKHPEELPTLEEAQAEAKINHQPILGGVQ